MSNTTLKCLWLTVVFILSVISSQASPTTHGPTTDKSNKEVIIINYDQFSATEISSLVAYTSTTYNKIDNAQIVIRDYSQVSNEVNDETVKVVISALQDVGISSDNIVFEKVASQGTAAYFSVSIGSATEVQ